MEKLFVRGVAIVLDLCLFATLNALPAGADVVWGDPNDYHNRHRHECVDGNRGHYEFPARGDIALLESPGSRTTDAGHR